MKGRLILGVPVVALFAVVFLGNVAFLTHACAEEWDSVAYFERERAEKAEEDASIDLSAPPHPNSRLAEAEERLEGFAQQWALSLGGAIFFGGLAWLGYRKLKTWPG